MNSQRKGIFINFYIRLSQEEIQEKLKQYRETLIKKQENEPSKPEKDVEKKWHREKSRSRSRSRNNDRKKSSSSHKHHHKHHHHHRKHRSHSSSSPSSSSSKDSK